MDHVVYLDTKAQELGRLLAGRKKMIVRGAAGRKMPYGRVSPDDRLFFIQNNGDSLVRACAVVSEVYNFDKLTETQSRKLLEAHQSELDLTDEQFNRWAGKRYLILISVREVCPVELAAINRTGYGNMDDWLPVGDIERVMA